MSDDWRSSLLTVFTAVLAGVILPAAILNQIAKRNVPIRHKNVVCAVLCTFWLPIAATLFYAYVGVPPAHGEWVRITLTAFDFCAFFMATVLLFEALDKRPDTMWLIAFAFVAVEMLNVIVPPAYMLLDVYLRAKSPKPPLLVALPCNSSKEQALFAHVSDLHITNKPFTKDGKTPGNRRLGPLLDAIKVQNPKYLIISGDVTDEGLQDQWAFFDCNLRKHLDGSSIKVVIATGNHDLNNYFGRDQKEEQNWADGGNVSELLVEPRLFRAARFQQTYDPALRTFTNESLSSALEGGPTSSNTERFKDQRFECYASCTDAFLVQDFQQSKFNDVYCRTKCDKNLPSLTFHFYKDFGQKFPLYEIDNTTSTAFIVMTTSIATTHSVGENAIGINGPAEVEHLKTILASLPYDLRHIVLVQHHPLLTQQVPPLPHIGWAQLHQAKDIIYESPWFLTVFLHDDLKESNEIYELMKAALAKRPGPTGLVAFGHRHHRSLGNIDRITFEEAPNLATDVKGDFGFYLTYAESGAFKVGWCNVPDISPLKSDDIKKPLLDRLGRLLHKQ